LRNHFIRNPHMRLLSLLILLSLLVIGCGKKGELYLPDTPRAPSSTVPSK
jgi:predicted small lipoprotein YifL